MTRRSLLDVNVLVALFDAEHIHHDVAHDWFSDHQPAVGRRARSPRTVSCGSSLTRRGAATSHRSRKWWRCSGPSERAATTSSGQTRSLCDGRLFEVSSARSPKHLTDVYLLGFALSTEQPRHLRSEDSGRRRPGRAPRQSRRSRVGGVTLVPCSVASAFLKRRVQFCTTVADRVPSLPSLRSARRRVKSGATSSATIPFGS